MDDFQERLAAAQEADMQGQELEQVEQQEIDELLPLEEEPEVGELTAEEEQEEPAAEEEQEDDDDIYTVDETGKIPLGRLKKEIKKRRELEQQYYERDKELATTKQQLENFQKALQIYNQEEAIEEESPSDYDPLDSDADRAYKAKMAELEKELNKLKGTTEENMKSAAIQAFSGTIQQQQSVFERDHPDFTDAFQHLGNVEYKKALRLTGDDNAAREEAGKALTRLAAEFYHSGKNVAAEMYDLAKDYGYNGSTKPKGVDISAVEKNSKKSIGVRSIQGASAAPAYTNPDAYFRDENISKIKKDGRRNAPVDPKKFQAILKRINGN